MRNNILKTISISTLASTFLLGATPNIGDIEKQIQIPKEVQPKQKELIDIGGVKKYAPPMKDDKSGKAIFVKSFKIENAINIDEKELQKLISSYNGKELTFNQLQEVTNVITKYYRQKGFFVARAYLPIQNINENDGVIIISIIEGNYGEFKLKNNSLVKDSVVQSMLNHAKRDNIVSTHTLERAMLIINDTPGAIVTQADVMPGKLTGTSDFAITTEATNKYDGYALVDNVGSKYTGKNRLMAGVNLNSVLGYGDKISISGLVSNGEDLRNGRIAYSAPLTGNGLRGEISYSQTRYYLTKEYDDLDGKGTSKTVQGELSYPVIRTRTENLYTTLSYSYKDLEDKLSGETNTRFVNQLVLGMDYDKSYLAFNKITSSAISLSLTGGNLNDSKNDEIEGNYSKLNLDLSHNINLTQELSLSSSLKTQYALGNKNLDGSEDFTVGGDNAVKLYPTGELSAENGYVFNIEAKYKLPSINGISNSIGVFYDRGKAWMTKNTTDEPARTLQDVGVGLYTSYNNFFSKVQVAFDANSENVTAEDPNNQSRVLFQAGVTF